jgi:hypothetical protein
LVPSTFRDGAAVPWPDYAAAAAAIAAARDRIAAEAGDRLLLGSFYATYTAPAPVLPGTNVLDPAAPPPAPVEAARLTVSTVTKVLRALAEADAAAAAGAPSPDALTACCLCGKVFKAPLFAVKHLHNKHGEEAAAARAGVEAGLAFCLADALFTRRFYFADPRRPMPWHEPGVLAKLAADNAEAKAALARRAMMARGMGGGAGGGMVPFAGFGGGGLLGAAPGMLPGVMMTMGGGGGMMGMPGTPGAGLLGHPFTPGMGMMTMGGSGGGRGSTGGRGGGRGGRGGRAGPGSAGPSYRDPDLKPSAVASLPAKVDYGASLISYEDI